MDDRGKEEKDVGILAELLQQKLGEKRKYVILGCRDSVVTKCHGGSVRLGLAAALASRRADKDLARTVSHAF